MKEIMWGYSWANIVMLINSIPKDKPDKREIYPDAEEITSLDELGGLF
jgi:hypothetical protein